MSIFKNLFRSASPAPATALDRLREVHTVEELDALGSREVYHRRFNLVFEEQTDGPPVAGIYYLTPYKMEEERDSHALRNDLKFAKRQSERVRFVDSPEGSTTVVIEKSCSDEDLRRLDEVVVETQELHSNRYLTVPWDVWTASPERLSRELSEERPGLEIPTDSLELQYLYMDVFLPEVPKTSSVGKFYQGALILATSDPVLKSALSIVLKTASEADSLRAAHIHRDGQIGFFLYDGREAEETDFVNLAFRNH